MALHPNFPKSPHAILDPSVRWFPTDETLREPCRRRSSRVFAPNLSLPNERFCCMMSSARTEPVASRPAAMSACEDGEKDGDVS